MADPQDALKLVLDKEIAALKAEVDRLQKEGAPASKVVEVQNRMRQRAIQRAKLG